MPRTVFAHCEANGEKRNTEAGTERDEPEFRSNRTADRCRNREERLARRRTGNEPEQALALDSAPSLLQP